MFFDTHTHIQFKIFDDKRDKVIEDCRRAGVKKIIAVGTDIESSIKAVEIAQRYEEVFAAVGIHPHHVYDHFHSGRDLGYQLKKVEGLIGNPKVIAVGETGLDKHDYPKTKYENYEVHTEFLDLQKKVFVSQINLAIKYQKTLIIHNIGSVNDLLEILEKNWDKFLEGRCVFHCCEPDNRLLGFAKDHNVYIGIDADIIDYKEKQEFVKNVPLELLVLETDSPFFVPIESKFPNTPIALKAVAKCISEILGIPLSKLEKEVFKNSQKLFNM